MSESFPNDSLGEQLDDPLDGSSGDLSLDYSFDNTTMTGASDENSDDDDDLNSMIDKKDDRTEDDKSIDDPKREQNIIEDNEIKAQLDQPVLTQQSIMNGHNYESAFTNNTYNKCFARIWC